MAKMKKQLVKKKKKTTSHKFPKPAPEMDLSEIETGIDALDRNRLAAQLAAGLLATRTQHPIEKLAESADEIAVVAYLLADKMKIVAQLDPLALNRQLALIKVRKNPVPVVPIANNTTEL